MKAFKPHWISLAPTLLRAAVALLAIKWLMNRDGLTLLWELSDALTPLIGDDGRASLFEAAPSILWGGFFVVAGLPLLTALAIRETTRLELIDGEIVVERGVFARTITDIPAPEVAGVDVVEPVLGRVFGYGTLVVETRGIDRLVMPQLGRARECAGLILTAKRQGWGN